MGTDYLPRTDDGLLSFATTFANGILGAPEPLGLDATVAGQYDEARGAFFEALGATRGPATRGPLATARKNDLKKALTEFSRRLGQSVDKYYAVTDDQRRQLGLPVRDTPTPIGPPTVMPKLSVKAVMGQVLNLELRRQDGTTRRKPAGVRAARLYSFVGATPPSELEAWKFEGSTTKTLPRVTFPASTVPGTTVWVTAQWMSPTDEPGPACAPVQSRINYMGLNEAA